MTETLAEVVVDASVVARGLMIDGAAARVVDRIAARMTVAHAPDLIVAEVSSALAVSVRAERRSLGDAHALFRSFTESGVELHETTPLAPAAVELAATTQLSAYDSFYAVLARALEVPLLTVDRKLAASVLGAVLVD